MAKLNLNNLQVEVVNVIEPFYRELLTGLGDNLASIYLTGSALGSDYIPKKSDINSLLIVKDVNEATLDSLSALGKQYGKKGVRAPLLMSPSYIERSLDVYPIEFLNLKANNLLVYGTEYLATLKIGNDNLRLQCERELKGILINLQQSYIRSSGQLRVLNQLLADALSSFIPIFKGLIHLKGTEIPRDKKGVLDSIASTFELDMASFHQILTARQTASDFKLDGFKQVFFECYRTLEELISLVDSLNV